MDGERGGQPYHPGEFKRTLDTSEQCYDDMKRRAAVKHSPMLTGLKERRWKVSQASLVAGHRSVNEAEWIKALGTFDTDKRDSVRITGRLCHTLLLKSLNYATGST
jgi:hypothetical protein